MTKGREWSRLLDNRLGAGLAGAVPCGYLKRLPVDSLHEARTVTIKVSKGFDRPEPLRHRQHGPVLPGRDVMPWMTIEMNVGRSKHAWFGDIGIAAGRGAKLEVESSPREGMRCAALACLVVLVFLGPIMTFGGISLSDDGSVERQIGYLLILGLTLYAVRPVATRASIVVAPVPVLLAFAWSWLSLSWAIDEDASLRRLVLTTTVATTGFLLIRHSNYRSMINVLRWCLVGAILVSYIVVFLIPSTGVHLMLDSAMPTALVGNWRGILGHKNFAGAVCALCILAFIFDAKRFPTALRVIIIVLACYFLYRSQSKTSVGMLLLAGAGGAMFATLSRRLRAVLIPALIVGGSAIWAFMSAYSDFLKTNFFDPTAFTGRGAIWSTLLRYAVDNLMFGAGFGSFWNIGPRSPVYVYGQGYVTVITVGHSGYLDELVAVGLPGLLLMVFATMVWPMWKLLSRTDIDAARGALIAAMLLFCIGHNITETGLFERDAIVSTFLFLTAAFAQYSGSGGERNRLSSHLTGDDLFRILRERQELSAKSAES